MSTSASFPETLRKWNGLSRQRTADLISSGIHRAAMIHGDKALAKAAGCTPKTIQNAKGSGRLPEAHVLGNLLQIEPTILWEWLGELGFKVVPKDLSMSPDMKTATEMSDALTLFIRALEDGARDHTETIQLAKKLRPLIPKLSALVAEADKHRVGERA